MHTNTYYTWPWTIIKSLNLANKNYSIYIIRLKNCQSDLNLDSLAHPSIMNVCRGYIANAEHEEAVGHAGIHTI